MMHSSHCRPLAAPFARRAMACLALACLVVLLPALSGQAAQAQDRRELLGSFRDWDAFRLTRGNGEKMCYMVSVPKSWQASKPNAQRGEIYITVTHRPAAEVRDQVNAVVGYPLKDGSEATARVDDGKRFSLFTQGDGAWLYTEEDDRALVQAMRRGGTLVVKGTSSRGTDTTDRYSLMGFTAAHNAISQACGV